VDSPIWSLAFRRRERNLSEIERGHRRELERLLVLGEAAIIGSVRQEVLSGIRDEFTWIRLRTGLRAFTDVQVETGDHERAAQFHNQCRSRGVAAGPTDLLLCAVASRLAAPVYTLDMDFIRYAEILPIELHRPEISGPR
jgi:predicted nucleic acid-binding protein